MEGDADQAQEAMLRQPLERKDPLDGYDLILEYDKIIDGTSKLTDPVKDKIMKRYLTGR